MLNRLHLLLFAALLAPLLRAQQIPDPPQVPANFRLDFEIASRLRSQLLPQSVPAGKRYAVASSVFSRLIVQLPRSSSVRWELRIVGDDQGNAYSSPDGTVYVESGLAQLAGQSAGLWAAILSHEIAHVDRRDWARRYIYQQSLESNSAASIVLGDPAQPSSSWSDSRTASADLARFCRQLEIDADREALSLMVRAGYHPHFMPALHHLLHVRGFGTAGTSLYAMHPCWEERDQELSRAYLDAGIEFEHRWPEWYSTPGGNPPVVVFAGKPVLKKIPSNQWQLQVPIQCENLAGAVEVVVHFGLNLNHPLENAAHEHSSSISQISELSGCTSPRSTVTFTLPDSFRIRKHLSSDLTVFVLDSWGAPLARADVSKR